MAIVRCVCGFSKTVDDKLIGKKASCPKCQKPIIVIAEEESTPSNPVDYGTLKEVSQSNLNLHDNDTNKMQWWDRTIPRYSAIIIIALITVLSFTPVFDKNNDHYFDKALKQTAASFAISKTLNAIVSVVQDIDMTVEPFGVGISLGVGESLDPANDIIEKFSNVMFISTLSLGVQKIFSEVGRCNFIKVILGIVSVMVILCLMIKKFPARDRAYSTFTKILIIFVLLRFAMPVVSAINMQVYNSIIQQSLAIEKDKLAILADEISNMDIINLQNESVNDNTGEIEGKDQSAGKSSAIKNNKPLEEKSGLMNSVGHMWSSAVEKTGNAYGNTTGSMTKNWNNLKSKMDPKEMKKKIDALTKKISEASTYLVNIAVIFVFQTIVSPLVVLWGLIKMTGYLMGSKL